jgi:hypothetical protein
MIQMPSLDWGDGADFVDFLVFLAAVAEVELLDETKNTIPTANTENNWRRQEARPALIRRFFAEIQECATAC